MGAKLLKNEGRTKEKTVFLLFFRVPVSSAQPKLRKVERKTKEIHFFFCRDGEVSLSYAKKFAILMAKFLQKQATASVERRKNEGRTKEKPFFFLPSVGNFLHCAVNYSCFE
ncbi:MAG: hypothetical protein K6D37_01780 [Prevotella sp.]|nr:hypothetical protein [Prevotella sp.]